MQVFGNNAITPNWYEARVQTLAETTSPEESRFVLTALEALRAPSEYPTFPLGLPVRWMSMLQHIQELEPEQRRQTSALVSGIALRVFSESIPPQALSQAAESSERPVQRPLIEIEPPSSPFLILSEGLFADIIDRLPPQSRCRFAQACRLSRNLVRAYREERLNRYETFPGLQPLISYFCQHIPDVSRPETFDQWQHELCSEAIPSLLENLLISSIPTEAEKMAFRTQSETQIASDPQLLHQLLFQSYQLNLVILALRGQWYDTVTLAEMGNMEQPLSERPSLREKAEAVATLLQLHADILFTISYDGPNARAGERMTCLPQEVLSLRVKNLFLDGHLIRTLPQEISHLGGDLQKLSLSQNRIRALPKSFFMLSNLSELHVDRHLVDQIPKQIRELPGLFINGELANPGLLDMLSKEFSEFAQELPVLAEELWESAKNLSRLALSPIRVLSGQA
jgi:hypothetical protein